MQDTFKTRRTLEVGSEQFEIASLPALAEAGHDLDRLPFALKILLENLLRREDGEVVPASDIQSLLAWDPAATPSVEIAFMPARVLLQDFTGVPAVADLAAMRDAMQAMGGKASAINPLQPAELVIDQNDIELVKILSADLARPQRRQIVATFRSGGAGGNQRKAHQGQSHLGANCSPAQNKRRVIGVNLGTFEHTREVCG